MQLMSHQLDAVTFAVNRRGIAAFYHEVGCGKTLSALSTYGYYQQGEEKDLKLMVFCPLSLIEGAWMKEIEKFTKYTVCNLHSKKFDPKANIYIANFEYLISPKHMEQIIVMLKSSTWMCAIDESSKIKSHNSGITTKILSLRDLFKYRIIMSGTPAPNIELEYWPQMKFLSDDILGGHFYKFKNTYFQLNRGKQVATGAVLNSKALREMFKEGWKYVINPNKRQEMFKRMSHVCHWVSARDCMDLPDEVNENRIVYMSEVQRKRYKEMKEDYIIELSGLGENGSDTFAIANYALTKQMKLRQIASGFVIDEFDKSVAVDTNNPKINALMEIVEECGQEQIIIWGQFRWEIATIVNTLKEKGFGVSELHGGIPQGQRIDHINDFLSGKNRFLVAHPDSAAHGLTFVNCHIAVFYSLSYSLEEYKQARGRIMRKGQSRNCLYFHLLAHETVDFDMLSVVQEKATLVDIAKKYIQEARKLCQR